MADGHDLAVLRGGGDLEQGRDRRRRERVVAAGLELFRQAGEETPAVVPDRARLPVHEFPRGGDLPAECLHDRLVAEADTKSRRRGREPPHDLRCRTRVGWPAGPGGDHEVGRGQARCSLRVDRVVAPHDHLDAQLAE